MRSKNIHVKLTSVLLAEIDQAAAAGYQSRSEYIREAIVLRLNNQRIVKQPSKDEFLHSLEQLAAEED
jgi:metal-responsive CopG/Arc/MetJ family transcriptional regulator